MTVRFVRSVTFLLAMGAWLLPAPSLSVAATPATSPEASGGGIDELGPAAPPGVDRIVAGDMVVDWLEGAPQDAQDHLASSGIPSDLVVGSDPPTGHGADAGGGDAHEAVRGDGQAAEGQHYEGVSGGYALFSATARWLPGGYTIRLTGTDRRVEQYRRELVDAARAASAATGMSIRVAPGLGGAVAPGRGEISVVVGSGPCGAGSIGCGGPSLTQREVVSGRVWIHPSGLTIAPAQRANLAAHELGHALGLQHFDSSWTDGRQVMYPVLSGTTSFRAGDGAGLRRAAGVDDRPAGTVTSRTYAAGRAHVAGTLSSGSRVRLSAGASGIDVVVKGGRFSGALPLPAGRHVVCAAAIDPAPLFRPALGCGIVDAPGAPVGHLDDLQGSLGSIEVRGWALDPQTADPVQVQIRRNGTLVATVRADHHRDDLGAKTKHYGPAHGYDVAIIARPGRNRVCVQVLGVGAGGDTQLGCTEIEVVAPAVDSTNPLPGAGDAPSIPRVPQLPVTEATSSAVSVIDAVVSGTAGATAVPDGLAEGARGMLTDR